MVNNCTGKGEGARSAEVYELTSLNFSPFTFSAECA
jgi:hypothetical protein